MGYEFENDKPIFLQIIEHIKNMIISKKFLPKQKLPSVRELSMMYGANPNTIQKALAELEELGLVFTESTNGKFVTADENLIEKIRAEHISQCVQAFYLKMEDLGLCKTEIIKKVKEWCEKK